MINGKAKPSNDEVDLPPSPVTLETKLMIEATLSPKIMLSSPPLSPETAPVFPEESMSPNLSSNPPS